MEVLAAPPFRAASFQWQARPGAWVLTVVCKATFTLLPGESRPVSDPDPPNDADDHWNDDERRSLHAASDLLPFKRRADVVLVGHTYAPRMHPVSSIIARMVAAGVDKSIEVHADRLWTQDGKLSQGTPFTKMSLRWERAAGGPDTMNPVGIRADARPNMYGQVPVPNLQPPGFYVGWRQDVIPPIGFGPIAPSWPGRHAMLHRHAASWDHRTWTERPLPGDIDAAFFNVAPPDQQVDEIRSDERIILENLHAKHPRLVTRLPGIAPQAMLERAGAAPQALRMRCDLLCIDTDRGVCNLIWRGQIALARPDERGTVTIIEEVRQRAEAADTTAGGLVSMALPFGGGARVSNAPIREDDTARTLPPEPSGDAMQTLLLDTGVVAAVLPFQEGRSPWAVAPLSPTQVALPQVGEDGTGTVFAGLTPVGPVLPFGIMEPVDPVPMLVAIPSAPAQISSVALMPQMRPIPWIDPESPPQPSEAVAGPPVLGSAIGVTIGQMEPRPRLPDSLLSAEADGKSAAPEPPSMIGPLATPEMAIALLSMKADAARPVENLAGPEAEDLVVKAPLPLLEYPIERCAAIAASIARRPSEQVNILNMHGLAPEQWASLERHWSNAILKETERGHDKLLFAHDDAYVAQLEMESGAMSVVNYAQIVVASERCEEVQTLTDRGLPPAALFPIQRVWLRRLAQDANLAEAARKEMEAAREEG